MTPDDPRLTAYALNQLTAAQREQVERELEAEPWLYGEVNDLMSLGDMLTESFEASPLPVPAKKSAPVPLKSAPVPLKRFRMRKKNIWGVATAAIFSTAACLALALYGLSVWQPGKSTVIANASEWVTLEPEIALSPMPAPDWNDSLDTQADSDQSLPPTLPNQPGPEMASAKVKLDSSEALIALRRNAMDASLPPQNQFPTLEDNSYLSTSKLAESKVPVLSGRASYPWVRRYLEGQSGGNLPPREAVRIEELVNAFPYDEPRDLQSGRIATGMRIVSCPWDSKCLLLGILFKNTSRIDDIEMKAKLHVSPDSIAEYRILGYAQPSQKSGPKAEIPSILPAGESQFVIYELRRHSNVTIAEDTKLAKLSVRSRLPKGSWDSGTIVCNGGDRSWLAESEDFRFAALMSAFGEALRTDDVRRTNRLAKVDRMADTLVSSSAKLSASRKEAVTLIKKAKRLSRKK